MSKTLDQIYDNLYQHPEYPTLKSSIDNNHKFLISHLSKEDRKAVLRIIDALDMICNLQTKDSFIQGFKLGLDLTTALQNYNDHSLGEHPDDYGRFFMS